MHTRFSVAIELLARIVIANPKPLTTAALAEAVAQPVRIVRPLLAALHEAGLVRLQENSRDAWTCPASLGTVTLADVFRCVTDTAPRRKKCYAQVADDVRSSARQSVDLLLMQATMAINQVVLRHLQDFDLGRLKAIGTSSSSLRDFEASTRSYVAEPA
jgi:DNA-binding IscR family transcriptional regulator